VNQLQIPEDRIPEDRITEDRIPEDRVPNYEMSVERDISDAFVFLLPLYVKFVSTVQEKTVFNTL